MYNTIMIERSIANILTKRGLTLSIAESCTGGLIADSLTNIPGSSKYFSLGIIAYSNMSKIKILGVSALLIKEHGAVSKETAIALAENVKRLSSSHASIGVTGIAGPGGATPSKPLGIVFIAVCVGPRTYFKKYHFHGTRSFIKKQAKDASLKLLKECLA